MTAQSPPIALQAGSHSAESLRRALGAMMGGRQGLFTPGAMAVSQKSGTPNMSVDVAEGLVAVTGDESAYQGTYIGDNRGVQNVSIAAADSTNPRFDLIVARVRDSAYSGATNTFTIEAVTGTPAGSPADPALPSGSVFVLARVTVAASVSSIVNANVTDLRGSYESAQYGLLTAAGGTVICTSTTRPASPFEGMSIFETDTDLGYTYNGSAWVLTTQLGAWTSYSPSLNQSGGISKTVTYAKYTRRGRTVTAQVRLDVTSGGLAGDPVLMTLPFTAATSTLPVGSFYVFDTSASFNYVGFAVLYNTTQAAGILSAISGYMGQSNGYFTSALASGDAVLLDVTYEAAS